MYRLTYSFLSILIGPQIDSGAFCGPGLSKPDRNTDDGITIGAVFNVENPGQKQ